MPDAGECLAVEFNRLWTGHVTFYLLVVPFMIHQRVITFTHHTVNRGKLFMRQWSTVVLGCVGCLKFVREWGYCSFIMLWCFNDILRSYLLTIWTPDMGQFNSGIGIDYLKKWIETEKFWIGIEKFWNGFGIEKFWIWSFLKKNPKINVPFLQC